MTVVPDKRAHYGVVLGPQVLLGDPFQQEPRPLPRFRESFDYDAPVYPALGVHNDRCYATPSPRQGRRDESNCRFSAVGVRYRRETERRLDCWFLWLTRIWASS